MTNRSRMPAPGFGPRHPAQRVPITAVLGPAGEGATTTEYRLAWAFVEADRPDLFVVHYRPVTGSLAEAAADARQKVDVDLRAAAWVERRTISEWRRHGELYLRGGGPRAAERLAEPG